MRKIAVLLVLLMITLQGGCQEDKTFKEVVTFEKGFRFTPAGQIQTVPFMGTSTNVTWESIIGKPSTFPPSAHTHPYSEITNKPNTVQLQTAISSMRGLLPPRYTTAQINAFTPPIEEGLEVYDLTLHVKKYWNGSQWKIVITGN